MRPHEDRQTYVLTFPAGLQAEQVHAWLQAVSGALRPIGVLRLPTIALEVVASGTGFLHRLAVPTTDADYVVSQLRTLVPGVRVEPDEEPRAFDWTQAVELGLSNPSRTLRIAEPASTAASLLASMQGLGPGEALLLQVVARPAAPAAPPPQSARSGRGQQAERDEINDRRAKLEEPNLLVVLRIAVQANTPARAAQLLARVQAALTSLRTPHTRFHKRLTVSKAVLLHRIDQASAPLLFPAQLSASELTCLMGWPIGRPHVAGLPRAGARHLPATEAIPRTGRIVAVSNFPGAERPLAISYADACKHLHVVGPTGVGKTTLLSNLAAQDMAAGFGLVLVETKGDLFKAVLDVVPKHRLDDVIIVDVTDSQRPVGFNLLSEGHPRIAVESVCQLFAHLYRDTSGVWTREVLFHGLMTLINRPEHTFIDLAALLVPRSPEEHAWRDELIRSLEDPELCSFWQRFENQPRPQQDRITQPVMDRIWQLNARPEIRRIIGQSRSSFSMRQVIEQHKILLINLAGIGVETAGLTGTLLINTLWNAAKVAHTSSPTALYLDEFQSLLQLPIDPEDMLARARSYLLAMVLAHQHLGQLPLELRSAIMANTRSKVVFQTTADDARVFAREFGRLVSDEDFINLGRFEVIARLATAEGMSSPVTGVTLPPSKSTGLAQQILELCRQRYGRSMDEVDAQIRRRTSDGLSQRPRPKLGHQKWS